MKRGDIVIIAIVIILISVGVYMLFFQAKTPGAEIVIEVDGKEDYSYPLHQPGRDELIEVQGVIGITKVQLGDGQVRVVESDCPDKVCVNMGWIDKPGTPIACLPNRVIVRVTGGDRELDLR